VPEFEEKTSWKEIVENTLNESKISIVDMDLKKGKITYSDKIKQSRKIEVISGDEEVTRAFLINELVNKLDYKPELIETETEYSIGRPKTSKPRIDIIVRDSKGKSFFFIETKSPDKFENDKEFIEDQLFKLARFEDEVKYLVYYTIDIKENQIVDRAIIIDYEKYSKYSDWEKDGFPSVSDELSPGYNKPQKPPLIKGDSKYDLRKTINRDEIEGLTKNLHNVLWGGGGTSDTEIFYSLVNIILSKIQDESEKENGSEYDFQIFSYGDNVESPEKVFDRINELYRRALYEKLNITDERKLEKAYVINEEKFPHNKLIFTVQTLENYSFLEGRSSLDGKDILGDFFETITREGFKQNKGQFFTPSKIVKFLLYGLEIDQLSINKLNNDLQLPYIIDPSCGSGTFLIEAMKIITKELKYKQFDKISSSRQVQERFLELFLPDSKENHWAREFIYGVDINFDLGTAAKVNMILHGDGSANIFVKDGLVPFRFYVKDKAPNYLKIYETDNFYNEKDVNAQFDVVISNPPFSVNLDNDTKSYLNSNFLFGSKKNSENLFIERWYQLLRENGRLGVVLPENVFDTTENKYIRLFLYKFFKIKAVISLPQLTFEPYTSTKTSLLFAQKKTKAEIEEWNNLWNKFGKQWSQLKTKVENYLKVYIEGKKKSRYPSIKEDTSEMAKNNIIKFLGSSFNCEDKYLTTLEILEKYNDEIINYCKIDKDLTEIFGFYNTRWVFGKVSECLDYKICMAEAENVGYKRTKRGEKTAPNDLYDMEIVPTIFDNIKYDITDDELYQSLLNNVKTYYEYGKLKAEYFDRTDDVLLNLFLDGTMKDFSSDDVLLRKNEKIKILDFMREQVTWD
jgi:type I restriction enzyme M protein